MVGSFVGAGLTALVPDTPSGAETVGTCTGMRENAFIKSTFILPGDGKPAGITDKNHQAAMSVKGIHAVGTLA